MRMPFSRKADLTLNVIVVAALVLIVLVVMVMIFTGSMGKWVDNLRRAQEGKTCEQLGGQQEQGVLCPAGTTPILAAMNIPDGYVCCKVTPPPATA